MDSLISDALTSSTMLCNNRFPLPGSPSTCTLDTVIVPLPSFLFLVALTIHSFLRRTPNEHSLRIRKWLHIAYLVLLGAQIAMTILELVRLGLENLGVGLLPVNTLGLLCAFIVLLRERVHGRSRTLLPIFVAYWLFELVVEAVKTARLNKLQQVDPTTSKDSKYPSSDWFLDNAVMLALYCIFCVTEISVLFVSPRRRFDALEMQKL
uniref:ABC transporter TMD0 domain-containing protein n=1 Tax=Mycena chlorophos TaxID=658473 RepID=A0ABQ0MC18_MYCCL|nr:predicted protein [Mycena chlorophos]